MNHQPTEITDHIHAALEDAIGTQEGCNIFVLTDTHTLQHCYPLIAELPVLQESHVITIPAGDAHKNIDSAVSVWRYLSEHRANRSSLLINLGGGMITDIGGFVASTFKRGIRYINVSTTLLGAVDAATGGKTGINFLGLKNEIGVFNPASRVLVAVDFFKTLDDRNLRSGFAEMVKHALLDSRQEWRAVLAYDLEEPDFVALQGLLERSIRIKERVVEQDPQERNIRKALNLGHTFGHAFETFSYRVNRPVLHGYAVMWGLLCELYVSHVQWQFPQEDLLQLKRMIRAFYGHFDVDCKDYEVLYELMTHDKKNDSAGINVTLLSDVGEIKINQTVSKEAIWEALDFYCMN